MSLRVVDFFAGTGAFSLAFLNTSGLTGRTLKRSNPRQLKKTVCA